MSEPTASSIQLRAKMSTASDAIPKIGLLSDAIGAPFFAKPATEARVLWVNKRWMLESQIDILDQEQTAEFKRWLLSEFAVVTEPEGHSKMGEGRHQLWADRYGGSFGASHGGSGRCGVKGAFNAKGIGRTPLTGKGREGTYSDGCMSLHGAIRETVNSEIAYAELPYRAVSVVAIIDLGPASVNVDGDRRTIVIRPNFLRPAHFERSVFFGSAGLPESDQFLDAKRVSDAVRAVTADRDEAKRKFGFTDLETIVSRMASQVGAGRAHRLSQGRCLSSNVSVDGEIADFGSFRSVPNWLNLQGEEDEKFGNELQDIHFAIDSLHHYFTKYSCSSYAVPSARTLKSAADAAIQSGFDAGCASGLGLGALDAEHPCLDVLNRFYSKQQMKNAKLHQFTSEDDPQWLYKAVKELIEDGETESDCGDTARDLIELIGAEQRRRGFDGQTHLSTLLRWLKPRPNLYYDEADREARSLISDIADTPSDIEHIDTYIDEKINRNRLIWGNLPENCFPLAHFANGYSSILYVKSLEDAQSRYLVSGKVIDQQSYFLDCKFQLDDLSGLETKIDGDNITVTIKDPPEGPENQFLASFQKQMARAIVHPD